MSMQILHDATGQLNQQSEVGSRFKRIWVFMVALVTWKNEDSIKSEGTRAVTTSAISF